MCSASILAFLKTTQSRRILITVVLGFQTSLTDMSAVKSHPFKFSRPSGFEREAHEVTLRYATVFGLESQLKSTVSSKFLDKCI